MRRRAASFGPRAACTAKAGGSGATGTPTKPWEYPAPPSTRRVGHRPRAARVTGNVPNRPTPSTHARPDTASPMAPGPHPVDLPGARDAPHAERRPRVQGAAARRQGTPMRQKERTPHGKTPWGLGRPSKCPGSRRPMHDHDIPAATASGLRRPPTARPPRPPGPAYGHVAEPDIQMTSNKRPSMASMIAEMNAR